MMLRKTLPAFAILMVVLAAMFLAGCNSVPARPAPTTEPLTPTPTVIEVGQNIYAQNCAVCHGVTGDGQPDWHIKKPDGAYPAPPHNANGHTWHHGDGLLYRTVRDGGAIAEVPTFKSGMPAFGNTLSPVEIRAVLMYIKTFWGDEKTPWGVGTKRGSQEQASIPDPFPSEAFEAD